MNKSVYFDVLSFINRLELPLIQISGGEPTEHPEILYFLSEAKKQGMFIFLLSNGMFLENTKLTERILETVMGVQVTQDERYYPQKVPHIRHPKIMYENKLSLLVPFGRAKKNNFPITRVSPTCFNIRSATKALKSIKKSIGYLKKSGKFCTPSINVDGAIVAGEAPSCGCIGHVTDSFETLTHNMGQLSCSACGLIHNLPKNLQIHFDNRSSF